MSGVKSDNSCGIIAWRARWNTSMFNIIYVQGNFGHQGVTLSVSLMYRIGNGPTVRYFAVP